MHLYTIVRGNKPVVDKWLNFLLSQFFPYRYRVNMKDPKEQPQDGLLQFSVRPIQLYEMVFPEGAYRQVLSMVQPYGERNAKMAYVIRKILGADKIMPEKIDPHWSYQTFARDIDVTPVGVKKDKYYGEVEFI